MKNMMFKKELEVSYWNSFLCIRWIFVVPMIRRFRNLGIWRDFKLFKRKLLSFTWNFFPTMVLKRNVNI
jgi:hypothetical protein